MDSGMKYVGPTGFRLGRLESLANARVAPVVNNSYVSLVLQVLLVIYIMKFAQKLPLGVMKFLNNPLIVIAALFLIVYTSIRNATTALLLAVAVVVTMNTINKYKNMSSLLAGLTGANADNVGNANSPEGFSGNGGMNMSGVTNHVVIGENGQPQQVNSHGDYRVSDSGILSNQYYCNGHSFDKAYSSGCGTNWGNPYDASYGTSDEYTDAVGSGDMAPPSYFGYEPNTAVQADAACCSKNV